MLAAMMILLTACSGDKTTEVSQTEQEQSEASGQESDVQEESQQEEEQENTTAAVQADWTIEQAIRNNMRYAAVGNYILYADEENVLYASNNATLDTGALSRYAQLVTDGEAGSSIAEIEMVTYSQTELILDTQGNLWYNGASVFPGYSIVYFDAFYNTSAGYQQLIAGVTEDGQVVYRSSKQNNWEEDGSDIQVMPDWNQARYVSVYYSSILAVNQDGTVVCSKVDENGVTFVSSLQDVAFVWTSGNSDNLETIVALKNDGTLAAYGEYPEEILGWTNLVYLNVYPDAVVGVQKDGTCLQAGRTDEDRAAWSNVMAFSSESAITADGQLLGLARQLVYAWDLDQPWDPATGRDKALQEYTEENHSKNRETLPSLG